MEVIERKKKREKNAKSVENEAKKIEQLRRLSYSCGVC